MARAGVFPPFDAWGHGSRMNEGGGGLVNQ